MSKLAIMQPYFLPYIGYCQLMAAVDAFVVYDDVQYRKGGWINRNRILVNGCPRYITLAVKHHSCKSMISSCSFVEPFRQGKDRVRSQIVNAYRNAPYFSTAMEVLDAILACENANVVSFLVHQLNVFKKLFDLDVRIILSSELAIADAKLFGSERLLAICKALNATHYINPVGGLHLYEKSMFLKRDVRLSFLNPKTIVYKQFDKECAPNLSIIDLLMFNDVTRIRDLLKEYELI